MFLRGLSALRINCRTTSALRFLHDRFRETSGRSRIRSRPLPVRVPMRIRRPSRLRGYELAQYYNSRFNQLQARQRWWFEMRSRILIETFYKVCHYLNVPGDKQFKWRKIWREINNIPNNFPISLIITHHPFYM